MGAVGSTGTTAANALAAEADVVIGIGTRWSDFTTASRTAFQDNGVRFVNINVARFDAGKHSGLSVVADAREALTALTAALDGYAVDDAYRSRQAALWAEWDASVEAAFHPAPEVTDRLADGLLTQGQVLGAVNELTDPRDVVLCAAGSMPGDIHKLWRVRDRKAYHVEYGYSCMGYEVPASHRHPSRRRVARRLRDGRRRRLPHDADRARHRRAGAGQGHRRPRAEPRLPLDRLAVGVARLAALRHAATASAASRRGRLDGDVLPVDLAANARSLGAHVIEVHSLDELHQAIKEAKAVAGRRRTRRHPRRDRPARPRARQRVVVGRAGLGGQRPRHDADGIRRVRRPQGHPASARHPRRRHPTSLDHPESSS